MEAATAMTAFWGRAGLELSLQVVVFFFVAAQAHCIRKATNGFRAESGAKRLCSAVATGRIVGRTALAVIHAPAPVNRHFH